MRPLRLAVFLPAIIVLTGERAAANLVPQESLSQNWSNAALITTDDNWNSVPGIVGRRGDNLTAGIDVNPQTILADEATLDVIANQADPNTLITGGVAEFDGIANPVVALQGSGTADAPFLILALNTTGLTDITLSYNLRDIDGSADNAVTQVALQYRVASSGPFTNIPAGYVADATTGPSLATLVTPVSVLLPVNAENQFQVQVRIITTNASGSNEWIGIDDIQVTTPAPCFVDIGAGLPGVILSTAAWGDYDNDGDLDILIAGNAGGSDFTRIYRNSGGATPTFTDIMAGLPAVANGEVAWGDYDSDGDLDIVIAGSGELGPVTEIYRNTGGPNPFFIDTLSGLPGTVYSAVAWGDYDNDGDLDLLLTGQIDGVNNYISRIYRNSGGSNPTFTDAGAGLVGIREGSVAWGDYDNDNDLDILISGFADGGASVPLVYANGGGPNPTFFEAGGYSANNPGVPVAWGDYDNDGDLDILIGSNGGSVLTNDLDLGSPSFSENHPLYGHGGSQGTAAWGDYDNDGNLDFLLSGADFLGGPRAELFKNSGMYPHFEFIGSGLVGVGRDGYQSCSAWGDYDNDGDLDVLVTGMGSSADLARVYRNECGPVNGPPAPPSNLQTTLNGTTLTLEWDAPAFAQAPGGTAATGNLSYNIRVGTSPGAGDIVSPMAGASGYRRISAIGNAQKRTSMEVSVPGAGPYYWTVQSINGAFTGSAFAPEQSTDQSAVGEPPVPAAYALRSGGPNPFSRTTEILFSQPARGPISLEVYDVAGRRVRNLVNGDLEAGSFTQSWDSLDDAGNAVPSGLYFVRMKAAAFSGSYRVSVIR